MKTSKKDRCRLSLDFASPQAMARFTRAMIDAGLVDVDTVIVKLDGLDIQGDGGIPMGRTFLLRKQGDRPAQMEVHITEETRLI